MAQIKQDDAFEASGMISDMGKVLQYVVTTNKPKQGHEEVTALSWAEQNSGVTKLHTA